MRAPTLHRYTWHEYLALEQASNVKHEFLGGEIYAMAGGTPEHAALAANVISDLHRQLEGGPCRVYTSDLRVRVLETGLGTYPDASVICGELERDPEDRNSVTNPTLLVEVSSEATEDYDRRAKFEQYAQLPSLQEYVLISHRERLIEVFRRTDGGEWERSEARTGNTARLLSVRCGLEVDRVYAGVASP